jgi:hypothetical protein
MRGALSEGLAASRTALYTSRARDADMLRSLKHARLRSLVLI